MKTALKAGVSLLVMLAVPAFGQTPILQQTGRWVQDYTGRKADPAVVFGTLPNGLRYAIMRNSGEADGVAMRLRFGSGSIKESDDQQGLAHFLEHMAFRGSKNVADGEVVRLLERQGLRFGPDTNAATSQDQTVYMFNFPKADKGAVDTGLMLFREIAQRMTLAPELIEAEKGVILSEERVRDVPAYKLAKANFGNALAGTLAVKRWPIGTVETIKAATPQRLRDYYETNYRPDNATLIIVGNIDPSQIEAEIKARFADWKTDRKSTNIQTGIPEPAAKAGEYVGEGVPDLLTLTWVRPVDRRARTEALDRERVVDAVATTILNIRIAQRAAKPGAPLLGGQTAILPDFLDSASMTQLAIVGAPEKWSDAVAAVVEEQRQALAQPVGNDEIQRAIAGLTSALETAAKGSATRKNAALADSLVRAVNEDLLFTNPQQDLELAKSVFANLTPEAVSASLGRIFSGKGPVLFRSTQGKAVGAAALEAQLATSYAKPLDTRQAETAVVWPYTDFGAAGTVTAQKSDEALGATVVEFANGSRLLVKRTNTEKDKIIVSVNLGNGRAGAPPEQRHALWAAELVPTGGTGKLSFSDIQRWSAAGGKLVLAQMKAGPRAFQLSGVTRPADLASQMQLLAAFARDPGFRQEFSDRLVAIGPMLSGQLDANPGGVFAREVARAFGGGDLRFSEIPDRADVARTSLADVKTLVSTALTDAADVTIVGDIDVATAISVMNSTFAAGPARPRAAIAPVQLAMPKPGTVPIDVRHNGRADQAIYGQFWALPDYRTDPKLSRIAEVAAAILQARMIDTVREKLGLTYSPSAGAEASVSLPGQGYFRVSLETPPSNFDQFAALLAAQLTDLATKPVTTDELERARKPLAEASAKQRSRNDWWATHLSTWWREPAIRNWLLDGPEGLNAVTATDVQAFAAKFIAGRKPVIITATSGSSAR